MKRIAKKLKKINLSTLTKKDKLYVGLDVHKKTISVAIWLNGYIIQDFSTPADYIQLVQKLWEMKKSLKKVSYEAGPTGFGLARTLQQAGLPMEVIAPSNIPRPSKRKSKTDRMDCRQIAEYSAKGMLHPIAIPTEQEEADRQVSRLRDQLVNKRRRVKQQIKSFLLQYSIPEPEGLEYWTKRSVEDLKELELTFSLRQVVNVHLEDLQTYEDQISHIDEVLREMAQQEHHRKAIAILRSHPGVGSVTAWAFHTELFNPRRFATSREAASYVGLSPRIHQSGETKREGPITKTGRKSLRSKLIEAAWRWVREDPVAQKSYRRLCANTGNSNKAIVGMARRLTTHLWCMLCREQYYNAAA